MVVSPLFPTQTPKLKKYNDSCLSGISLKLLHHTIHMEATLFLTCQCLHLLLCQHQAVMCQSRWCMHVSNFVICVRFENFPELTNGWHLSCMPFCLCFLFRFCSYCFWFGFTMAYAFRTRILFLLSSWLDLTSFLSVVLLILLRLCYCWNWWDSVMLYPAGGCSICAVYVRSKDYASCMT